VIVEGFSLWIRIQGLEFIVRGIGLEGAGSRTWSSWRRIFTVWGLWHSV